MLKIIIQLEGLLCPSTGSLTHVGGLEAGGRSGTSGSGNQNSCPRSRGQSQGVFQT